jgi:hypothetical protein
MTIRSGTSLGLVNRCNPDLTDLPEPPASAKASNWSEQAFIDRINAEL